VREGACSNFEEWNGGVNQIWEEPVYIGTGAGGRRGVGEEGGREGG
jgi:hypothetical protein